MGLELDCPETLSGKGEADVGVQLAKAAASHLGNESKESKCCRAVSSFEK